MTRQAPTSPVREPNMVFTSPSTEHGFHQGINLHAMDHRESKARIVATAADAMAQIAQGRPEGGGGDAVAKTNRGGMDVSHDDAPNRDMMPQAPSSSVRSTDMVFTGSTKTLHARARRGTPAAANDRTAWSHGQPQCQTLAQPRLRGLTRRRAHTAVTPTAPRGGERPPRPPSHRKRAGRRGDRGGDPAGTGLQTPDPARE
jgi:hypothetical protein